MADRQLPAVGVCGFGRCGSTMVMAMLAAGGIPPVDDAYPGSFERAVYGVEGLGGADLSGRAVKLLDSAMRERLPKRPGWRFVWCHRDPVQQSRSAVKLLRWLGVEPGATTAVGLRHSYRDDGPRIRRRLAELGPVHTVQFESALMYPHLEARRLADFLAPDFDLDVDAACRAVHARGPACLPDMAFEDSVAPPTAEPLLRVNIGCTADRDEANLAEARRQTHDLLLDDIGDAQLTPVEWRMWPAPAGLRVMRDLGMEHERRDVVRYLRAHPGGMLIVASVEVDPDRLPDDKRETARVKEAGRG